MKKIALLVIIIAVVALWFLFNERAGLGLDREEEKKYSNQPLGFEIKYPENWRSEECTYEGFGIIGFGDSSERLLICNSDAPPLSYVNVQVGGPAAQFDLLLDNLMQNLDNVSRADAKLDGRDAVRVYGETKPTEGPGLSAGIKMTMVFAKEKGKVYSVNHWNLENKDYTEEFDTMLSGFKFLNGDVACIQVITAARNPQTGETKDFPTPCDVPEGWTILN